MTPTVRKRLEVNTGAQLASSALFGLGPWAHEMALPMFRLGLGISIETTAQTHPEVRLLGDSRSYCTDGRH